MTIDLQDHPKLFSYVMEMIATNNHNIILVRNLPYNTVIIILNYCEHA
jgi:hypothetical protein